MDSGAEGSGGGAESTAENPGREGGLQRVFYCHECSRRTFPNTEQFQSFTCNICGSGFVEDVTLREDSPSSQSDEASFADFVADSLRADSEENMEDNPELWAELTGNDPPAASGGGGSGSGRPRRRHHARMAHIPIGQAGAGNQLADQFIQSLIANLTGGATRGGGPLGDLPPGAIAIATGNGRGGFPGLFQIAAGPGGGGIPMMPLYGNPGDYAWGRGGFDSIVTQLLNQMDGTGPPPMSENDIKSIPKVKVTQSQVDANLQCSVCWDDFKLDEEVRQLKCDHYFHEDCIIPWLELHNTCPICRKEQEDETGSGNAGENSESQEPESSATGGAGSVSHQQACPHTSSSSSTSTATATGTRNSDNLMEALGRYSSVFNSLLGIPPETQQSRTQTAPPTQSHSGATSTSAPTATMTPSSRSTSSTSTASVTDQNPSSSSTAPPGGSSSQNQFHDMDLE